MTFIAKLLLLLGLMKWWSASQAMKIAFVGDTGTEDEQSFGYGHLTMKMIEDQGVDLVIDVGDFDYWGRCFESYNVTQPFMITSTWGRILQVPADAVFQRFKWQDGAHKSTQGWEVGVVATSQQSDLVLFNNDKDSQITSPAVQDRMVISDRMWKKINRNRYLNQTDFCFGMPWDGPSEWNQFVRNHDFDFLGASGNAEVKQIDLGKGFQKNNLSSTQSPSPTKVTHTEKFHTHTGGPEIWASHQRYMHALYMERIYNTKKGACHGYYDPKEPGSVEEYGERYSCFYNHHGNEDFHFVILGWWQGSDEHWNDDSTEERRRSIDFIEKEFNSTRSRNVRWRFCVHHMTSAKLSAGDDQRDQMALSGITDTCRKYGAIIVSGHHHLYSRTKLLQSVGGPTGEEPVLVADASDSSVNTGSKSVAIIQEGVTMSLTVGMGGYDSSCNGKYANAAWMATCVASLKEHRGAVIAEFNHATPWTGTFQYLNSLDNAAIVDEFVLTSRLPGWNTSILPVQDANATETEGNHSSQQVDIDVSTEAPSISQISGEADDEADQRTEAPSLSNIRRPSRFLLSFLPIFLLVLEVGL
jgi:hypothetical protein